MITAFTVLAALILDAWLGEPRRYHPLVGFGCLAQELESRMYTDSVPSGATAVVLLVVPPAVLASLVDPLPWSAVLDVLLLYLALGWRSLEEHAGQVRDASRAGDPGLVRRSLALMVSRDTAALDEEGAAKATLESVLENGNDAVFGAIFWFVLAGPPGVVLYRLANTLDAMWGYRNGRYRRFGRVAARLDDVLSFAPARLTALSYALVGSFTRALRCWRAQGAAWKSPNAGTVMAAGAGSLGVLLGGPASYDGTIQERPRLGEGRTARIDDIDRALCLIRQALSLWVLVLFAGGWFVAYARTA